MAWIKTQKTLSERVEAYKRELVRCAQAAVRDNTARPKSPTFEPWTDQENEIFRQILRREGRK